MSEPTPSNPLVDARAQAVRRILELRGEVADAESPDLRALIARTSEANATAKELSAVLPTRIEAAIGRALADGGTGLGRRLEDVQADTAEIADTVARVEQDLLAERLGRVEDMELLIEVVSGGIAAIRADIGQLNDRVAELAARLDRVAPEQPGDASLPPASGRHAYRSLFARTDRAESRTGESAGQATEHSV
jgi:hypothetical protein